MKEFRPARIWNDKLITRFQFSCWKLSKQGHGGGYGCCGFIGVNMGAVVKILLKMPAFHQGAWV